MAGISPKLPLSVDKKDGVYRLTKEVTEAMTQNLKMLLLTNPGERMMDPFFGVGIRKFLFEQGTSVVYGNLSSKIYEQAARYLPQINIKNILFNESPLLGENEMTDSNILSVSIEFSIKPAAQVRTLVIPIT